MAAAARSLGTALPLTFRHPDSGSGDASGACGTLFGIGRFQVRLDAVDAVGEFVLRRHAAQRVGLQQGEMACGGAEHSLHLAHLLAHDPSLATSATGRWTTLLGTLLDNRVALLPALELSTGAVSLRRLQRHLLQAQGEIRRGRALSAILAEQGWIAPTRLNLIRVGERAGELPRMLSQLGRLHTDAAREQMKRLLTLIEPVAILLIGAVIGVIMVAVVLAITSLNTARL